MPTILNGTNGITNSGNLTQSNGTANGVAYLNGSKVLTTGSALTFDGGTLIGTAADGTNNFKAKSTTGVMRFSGYIPAFSGALLESVNGAESGYAPFTTVGSYFAWNNGSEQMRLTSTGLGIGTSSPGGILHASAANGVTILESPGVSSVGLRFRTNAADRWQIQVPSSSSDLAVYTGAASTERLRLDSSGNLGLGVTPVSGGNRKHLTIGGALTSALELNGSGAVGEIYFNSYYNGIDYYYANTGAASKITFNNEVSGGLAFFNKASGTGGATVSWGNPAMTLDTSGNLLVGYTSSNGSYKLQVNSQIFATSSTIATSDGRYKENITPLTGALQLVAALNPVQFSWKQHAIHAFDTATPTIGFIAQEVKEVLKDKPFLNSVVKSNECVIAPAEYETVELKPAVEEVKDEEGNVVIEAKPALTEQRLVKEAVTEEFLGIAEGNLIALLTKAIHELKSELDEAKARISTLESQ